ncbi:hypothetical protein CMI38_06795 [Candidatus Pacearchaeota archaeon]|jgi:predicted RNA binding protein YcfA (HicA-like mRNA interferase family)|nr:hypothetical protein [Candidatus Pacearchaeota archaeon]|tara:strand:- start:441 stop:665 length:225 start_codon:yes stop_codon:yes gene_type:complete
MELPQISGFKLIKILSKFGFNPVRQKGSHVQLQKIEDNKMIRLTVPIHEKLKKGTLSRIIKDSKVNQEEFCKYL